MKLLPAFALASASFFGLLCFQFQTERSAPAPAPTPPPPTGEIHPAEVESADVMPQLPDPEVPPAPDAELVFVDEAELPVWGFSREAISIGPDLSEPIAAGPVADRALFDVAETVETKLAGPLRAIRIPTQRRIMSRAGPRRKLLRQAPFTVTVRVVPPAWIDAAGMETYARLSVQRRGGGTTTYVVRVDRKTGEAWVHQDGEWIAAALWLKEFDPLTG